MNRLVDNTEVSKLLLEHYPGIIYLYDLIEKRNIYINETLKNILGFSDEEINDFGEQILSELMHPEDRKKYYDTIFSQYAQLGRNEYINYEYRMRHKNGNYCWLHSQETISKFDEEGRPLLVLGIAHVITERKEQETKIRQIGERYQTLIKNFPNGAVFLFDKNLKYIHAEGKALQEAGFSTSTMIGKTVKEVFPADLSDIAYENQLLILQGKTCYYEVEFNGKIYANWGEPVFNEEKQVNEGVVFAVDITKHQLAEKALRSQKDRILWILEGTNVGTWEWNVQSGETIFNERWAEIIGYTLEELSPVSIDTWTKFIHPDDLEESAKKLNACFDRTSEYYHCESRMKHKNGKWIWVIDRGKVATWTADGKPEWMYGTHQDISERKLAEEKIKSANQNLLASEQQLKAANQQLFVESNRLKSSEEKFRTVMERSPFPMWIADENGLLQNANKALKSLLNLTDEQLIGKYNVLKDENIQDDRMRVKINEVIEEHKVSNFRLFWESGKIKHTEFPDSHKLWMDVTLFPLVNDKNELTNIVCQWIDITENKRAEEELKEAKERFDLAINATNDGLFDWNLVTNEIYYSPNWKKMLGYEDHELPNDFSIWEKLTKPEDVKKSWEMQHEMINKKRDRFEIEFQMKHKKGHWIEVLSRAKAIFDENGKAIRMIGTHIDITERKKAQEELYNIEWLLTNKPQSVLHNIDSQPYGDLTELNHDKTILDAVGKEMLKEIVDDYLGLLETSAAVYEKNGDYAFGIFSSGWCKLLDNKSRELCGKKDISEALNSGKWLCHESCWTKASHTSIKTGKPTDIQCHGGINIYAQPIVAFNEIIGSINFGYGNPPKDLKTLGEIAHKFDIPLDRLIEEANAYKTRPSYFVELAKERLQTSARIIGTLVELNTTRKQLEESEVRFKALHNASFGGIAIHEKGVIIECNQGLSNMTGFTYEELIGADGVKLLIAEESRELVMKNILSAYEKPYEVMALKKNGEKYAARLEARQIPYKGREVRVVEFRDITETKASEEALRRSETKLRNIFENSTNTFYSHSVDHVLNYLSPQVEQLLGYSQEEAMKEWTEFVSDNPINEIGFRNTQKAIETGERQDTYELELVRKDKKKIFVEVRESPVVENGKTVEIVGSLADITDRKLVQDALKKSERDLNEIVMNSPVCIKKIDLDFNLQFMSNPGIEQLKIEDVNAFYGKPYPLYFFPEKFKKEMLAKMEEAKQTGKTREIVGELADMEGNRLWYQHIIAPVKDDQQKFEYLLIVSMDISELKKAEQSLQIAKEKAEKNNQINEARLKLIGFSESHTTGEIIEETLNIAEKISDSKIGFFHFVEDDQETVTLQNWSSQTKAKYCQAQNQGEHYSINEAGVWVDCLHAKKPIIHNDYKALSHKKGMPAGHAELIRELTVPVIHNGKVKAIMGVGNKKDAYEDADVENIKLLAYLSWEIIEKLKLHQNLIHEKAKAEESDRLKSAFLANMSHEIRTPMNGILGFTNLLSNPKFSDENKAGFINIIRKSGARLINTLDDIIEISKIEVGEFSVNTKELNIREKISDIVSFFATEASEKGLQLRMVLPPAEQDHTLETDESKFESILTNLIKNAIKYSDSGTITFGYDIQGDTCKFYCKDEGIGIPEHRIAAVFNRFEQADIEDRKAYEGSGLGLAICKAYVEMLEGEIWVESLEGQGSTFFFTLPFQEQEKLGSPMDENSGNRSSSHHKSNKKWTILIVEDDEVTVSYLQIILANYSEKMYYATTGMEAIEKLKTHPDINLILMDIKLPSMDGYEATRRIRKFNKKVKIIAQTAYAFADDQEKAIQAGCDDYIAKPLAIDDLLAKLNNLMK